MTPKSATTDGCVLQRGQTQSFADGFPGTQLLSHTVQRPRAINSTFASSASVLPIPSSSTIFPHFLPREQSNDTRQQLWRAKLIYKLTEYVLYK